MKGYKVFKNNLCSLNDFQYEVGKTYSIDESPIVGQRGFHFAERIVDCIDTVMRLGYSFRVCEVEALGEVAQRDKEYCTNKIKIVKEILDINERNGNFGKNNTGFFNHGNRNTGNENEGNYNTGDMNDGWFNEGDHNLGDYNIGDYNFGDCNVGDYNFGDSNIGDSNIGDNNIGDSNIGTYNIGDWNFSDYNTGVFNTTISTITFFDKESDWTLEDWHTSRQAELLNKLELQQREVKDKTKKSQIATQWFESLSQDELELIKQLPNFDMEKFKLCIGWREEHVK